MSEYKIGDSINCKVIAIEQAAVIVETDEKMKGSIAMSEVAAGRIRNIREYVIINKQIVCKILAVHTNHLELSLRRVTGKEREEIEEQRKKEKTLYTILKSITKNAETIKKKIEEREPLASFFDKLKADPSVIRPFVTKEEAEKIMHAVQIKDAAPKQVTKTITLTTSAETGLQDIQDICTNLSLAIKYLGSGKLSLTAEGKEYKQAHTKIAEALAIIEKRAKEKKVSYSLKETK